jgi:outer membrane protein OmpA-like peptidoglycan-associated protein
MLPSEPEETEQTETVDVESVVVTAATEPSAQTSSEETQEPDPTPQPEVATTQTTEEAAAPINSSTTTNAADLIAAVTAAVTEESSAESVVEVASEERKMSLAEQKQNLRTDLSAISINEILFQSSKAVITASSKPILDQLGDVLNKYPDVEIEVSGHTDSSGRKSSNQKLSQLRADAVKEYLVTQHNIDEDKVSSVGYGQDFPIVSNETPEGRALNRRIEINF